VFVWLLAAAGCGSSPGVTNDAAGMRGGAGGASGLGGAAGTGIGGGLGGASAGRGGSGGSGGQGGTGGAGGTPRPCAHEIDNPWCWSARDLTDFTDIAQSFSGAIFDGRYVTFVNATSAPPQAQVRFDSQGDFAGNTGWSSFYPNINTLGMVWRGGVFDGRYVYLTPGLAAITTTGHDVVARFDTQAASFAASAGWTGFDLTTAGGTPDATIPGYQGAAFDGRYVYFAPSVKATTTDSVASGKVARYDTQATFAAAASWSYFDVAAVDANAAHFAGLVFDGRYLYFVPNATTNAHAARYDTQAAFANAASWSTFDTTSLDPHAGGYRGGVFDGRYVYFVPVYGEGTSIYRAVIARVDTQGSFTSAASWSTLDAATVIKTTSFAAVFSGGGAFDGRHVYFVPDFGTPLLRYDSQAPFTAPSSWTETDVYDVTGSGSEFNGAAFDGRYLYLVPGGLGDAMRFDAREPGPVPAAIKGGSFY